MKTYSVKQIAEMLNTNPETVRRWIRDNKLKAVQISRKDGNIVKATDLKKFLERTPKFAKLTAIPVITDLPPVVGIGAIAGGIVASALFDYLDSKSNGDVQVTVKDFEEYLRNEINKLEKNVSKKRSLIQQTETEIEEISKQIGKYRYLLEHEDLLEENLSKATRKMEE